MHEYGPETYGDRIADVYDRFYSELFDNEGAVSFLAERARGGPALELGIGTGRIAVPLKAKGIDVHGIDSSSKMIEHLRAKPGGPDIPVTLGDFAEFSVTEKYPLIYVVFNTFFALTNQEDQLRCIENVAKHLTEDGLFVVEAFVPDLSRFVRHQNTEVMHVETDEVMMSVGRHDPVNQMVRSMHILFTPQGTNLYPIALRYVYQSELDLMARLAGLVLRERYENWRMSPQTSDSKGHVSVYGRA
jgi:SAM-dependent methyltransferase